MRLSVQAVKARFRAPFVAPWGTVTERELLLVSLQDRDGARGWGEAAPLPGYDGVSVEQVGAALEAHGRAVAGARGSRAELLAACAAASPLPQALAAIDLALWDLEGRRRGVPVHQLLPAAPVWDIGTNISNKYPNECTPAAEVEVNATIGEQDPDAVAAGVGAARAAGFRCVKLKVALGDDAARLAAARSAGGAQMAIRIDANGGWSVDQAVTELESLKPFGVELCEEPVHGLEEVERVAAASSVPVALDESVALPGALERRIADAACLKIAASGGISGLLRQAANARAAGYRLYIGSTLDGPLGIAAGLHVATAVRPRLPCGLGTLAVYADRPNPLPPRRGRIAVPSGPGLGAGLVEWYR